MNWQKQSFQKEFEGVLAKISFVEEQLHDFQQKHGYLQKELLLTKKETKTCKSKYASKCASLSKRNSQDKKDEQQLKQINQNDIVEVTKYNIDIPDERLFLPKFFMVLHQEKKYMLEKFDCMPEYILVKESLL